MAAKTYEVVRQWEVEDKTDLLYEKTNNEKPRGAAIAQWIRLGLPSSRPGFESQARHLRFFIYSICAIFVIWKERK